MRRPFRLQPDGVDVRLSADELVFLAGLPQLLARVDQDTSDPGYARLHVDAYPDDQEAQLDLEAITGPDLAAARGSDRDSFLGSIARLELEGGALTLEEAEGWLAVLGDSRLALAARLGITEPGWEGSGEPEDPSQAALGFLTYLQSELVDVLTDQF